MGPKLTINWRYFSLEQVNSQQGPEWKLWEQPDDFASRGLWAFRAAEAARGQGEVSFERFHSALLHARHQQGKDIADRGLLAEVASAVGLEVSRFREDLARRELLARLTTARFHVPLAVTLYVANAALPWVYRDPFGTGFYLSLLATGYVVIALMQVRRRDLPSWAARTDRVLGDLSYPVFLCHFPVAAWVIHFGLAPARGPLTLLVAAIGSSMFAWLVHTALESPVNRLRDRIRGRASRFGPGAR